MSNDIVLFEYEWQTLRALANASFEPLHADGPLYKRAFERVLSGLYVVSSRSLRLMLHVLSFRGSAIIFTKSHKLLTEMSPEECQQVLHSFTNSRLAHLRLFASAVNIIALLVACRQSPELRKTLGNADTHPYLLSLKSKIQSKETIWHLPKFTIPAPLRPGQPSVVTTDVVIVGSGCSAMVASYLLTKKGFKVIIVEKGYHLNAITSPEHDFQRDIEAYESEGNLTSADVSTIFMAGATFGGGGAVNWSCSLRPNEQVRREFVEKGAPLYGSNEFDDALAEIERVMKVSTKFGVEGSSAHSFTNNLILEASKKLNYRAKATEQNTGKHQANTGFVEFGSRQGEVEGGIAEWYRSSFNNGAQLLQRGHVVKIRHQHGYASGVEVVVYGSKNILINCKRVICAAGSLQTPVLLQRSGFKNPHIGKGLKVHPSTVAYGIFPDQIVNKRLDPIMTAVCSETDNLDGEGHGPKIEAIFHGPLLTSYFLPYRNAKEYLDLVESYEHLCALLVITRDLGEGTVSYYPSMPTKPYIDYTPSKYDLNALLKGSLVAANMLYIQGAQRIVLSSTSVPDFISNKPVSERSIWDEDYQMWYQDAERTEFFVYNTKVGSAHQMSTCRMHVKGPKFGAVDGKGRLYECPNVHVIDTSVFPAASGVNPMITCMATAHVLTNNLIVDLIKLQTKL